MSRLTSKRVALIGGAGFIGHHLALGLRREGAEVSVIDGLTVNNLLHFAGRRPRTPQVELYTEFLNQRLELLRGQDIPVYVQDARDYHALSRVLSEVGAEVVIQLAAVSHAGRSNKDPYSTFDHSLRTLENALDWARGEAAQFIYFSSSMVYGQFEAESVDEDHPLNSVGIYGALKVAGERLVVGYQQTFDLPYTILRPSALYGPRCVSRRVIQIFLENALAGERLSVRGDLEERLDFTHIDDLVQGVLLCLANPRAYNQVFNLTYGRSRSLGELLQLVRNAFPEIEHEVVAREQLMPVRGTLSTAKAEQLLGYRPAWGLEEGFRSYLDWYRKAWPGEL